MSTDSPCSKTLPVPSRKWKAEAISVGCSVPGIGGFGADECSLPPRSAVETAEAKPTGGIVCGGAAANTAEPSHVYVAEGSEEVAKDFWALLLRAGYTMW